ncbi:MAG: hypothetical protein GY753_09065, partial [Gammaproteobacteria bacterium]|nr:hypothetical protein [Gammaproteobacteria bacterium]
MLQVYGELIIQGNVDSRVLLTSAATNPSKRNWKGIVVEDGATVSLDHVIVEYADKAIDLDYVTGATVTVSNSELKSSDKGVHISGGDSALTITDSTLTDNTYGFYMLRSGTAPTITGSTLTANQYGVYLNGHGSNDQLNPLPVITGNSIYDNTSYNYYTDDYANAANTVLNATGNWWGNADPGVIAAKIYDHSDSSFSPVVDFRGYLDGEGGNPASTITPLLGSVTGTLSTGWHEVLGALIVPSGQTLTIPAGATLSFAADTMLQVYGELIIQGNVDSRVLLTSAATNPAKKNWKGIVVEDGATVSLNHVIVEYASVAIDLTGVTGATVTVSNSELRSSITGVYIYGGNSVLTITDSTLTDNIYGLHMDQSGTAPTITGSTLTANGYGVYLNGHGWSNDQLNPLPVITGNSIYDNTSNYYTQSYANGASIVLNATGNWWGSADPYVIAAKIANYCADCGRPYVDFRGYLDGIAGNPASTVTPLAGPVTGTLSAGEYEVLGALIVPSGQTLTIPAGATLSFAANTMLQVYGELIIQGNVDSRVLLTSAATNPSKRNWK